MPQMTSSDVILSAEQKNHSTLFTDQPAKVCPIADDSPKIHTYVYTVAKTGEMEEYASFVYVHAFV